MRGHRYGDFLESGSYIKQRGRFATDDVPADEQCYLADPDGRAFEFVPSPQHYSVGDSEFLD